MGGLNWESFSLLLVFGRIEDRGDLEMNGSYSGRYQGQKERQTKNNRVKLTSKRARDGDINIFYQLEIHAPTHQKSQGHDDVAMDFSWIRQKSRPTSLDS
eukprot:scaffold3677_cov206-Amphora_coffeaeformis.AAC.6